MYKSAPGALILLYLNLYSYWSSLRGFDLSNTDVFDRIYVSLDRSDAISRFRVDLLARAFMLECRGFSEDGCSSKRLICTQAVRY